MSNSVDVVVAGEDKTGEVFNAVKKHLDETRKKAEEMSERLEKIGESIKSGLEMAGVGLGVHEVVDGFKEMIESTMEAAVQIAHLSQQTGISSENLSTLRFAAQATGIDFDVLARGFKKLAVSVYDANTGSKGASQGFAQLGITSAELRAKGDDMYGVLTLLAKKFSEMPEGIAKSDTASKIFGARMGSEMIPVLNELGGKLEELQAEAISLGVVWDEHGIKKMEAMHRSTVELKAAFTGLAMELTNEMAPALTKLAQWESRNLVAGLYAVRDAAHAAYLWMAEVGLYQSGHPELIYQIRAEDAKAQVEKYRKEHEAAEGEGGEHKHNPPPPHHAGEGGGAAAHADASVLEKRLEESRRRYSEALEKSAEVQARAEAKTAMEINEEMYKQKLISEIEYLASKYDAETQEMDAEERFFAAQRSSTLDQIEALSAKQPKSEKERVEIQIRLNELQTQNLSINDKLLDIDQRRAKAAREIEHAMQNAKIELPEGEAPDLSKIGGKRPDVLLAKQPLFNQEQVRGAAEKLAHSIYDPLFDLNSSWDQKWKAMQQNLLRDLGQLAESQLFGLFFGDAQGRGGRGLDGTSWEGNTNPPARSGLQSGAGGILGGLLNLFKGKSSVTSNGALGAGAGTIPSPAASLLQAGADGGTGGVQVILNNNGAPLQVDQTQLSNDGGESQIVQIMLKQLETNGPVAQGIMGMMSMV